MIYHIAPKKDWASAQATGSYQADTLMTQGFIHCSDRQRIVPVANRFYYDQEGLIVLAIDPDLLLAEVRYESVEDGGEPFPHIYGPLNLDAVVSIAPLDKDSDGSFVFPEELV